jgi:DNA-binding beta-propeller fold protein YncE
MPHLNARIVRRLAGAAVTLVALAAPQLAWGQAPGSLAQLGSPNSCIGLTGSECPTTTGTGLTGSEDVAVSPDGKNVYVVGANDDAIAEFSRGSDGSLIEIGCVADPFNDGTSTCAIGTSAAGLVSPQAIVISPDGATVYVAAADSAGNGSIAELARGADGLLTPLTGHGCIAEASDSASPCPDGGHGITAPTALAISPDGTDVYAANRGREDIATFTRAGDGTLTHIITDSVVVTDFIRHRTILLHAGQSYLAPNRRRP